EVALPAIPVQQNVHRSGQDGQRIESLTIRQRIEFPRQIPRDLDLLRAATAALAGGTRVIVRQFKQGGRSFELAPPEGYRCNGILRTRRREGGNFRVNALKLDAIILRRLTLRDPSLGRLFLLPRGFLQALLQFQGDDFDARFFEDFLVRGWDDYVRHTARGVVRPTVVLCKGAPQRMSRAAEEANRADDGLRMEPD